MMKCCYDWRVWIGRGVPAAGLFIAGWMALPVLARLACPLSMLVMLPGIRQGGAGAREPDDGGQTGTDRAAEFVRLRHEIAPLKHQADQLAVPAGYPATAAARFASR